MIKVDEMIRILDGVEDLPTIPTIYAKVSGLINDPKTSVSDVAKVIEVDQALTSKILRLVNSSFFGFSRQIVSIHQAIVLLGFNTIRNTVLSVSVFDMFSGIASEDFDMNRFWKHSISCSIISTLLDKKLKTGFNEETFVAGLLHDMGKIILNRYFNEDFVYALKYAKQNHITFYDSEQVVIGFSHDEVGEYLADRWHLPYSLVETLALHHQPNNIRSNPKLVSLIHLANTLSYRLGYGFSSDFKKPDIHPFVFEELDIEKEALPQIMDELKEMLLESHDLFSLVN